jgi:hypothetical protein
MVCIFSHTQATSFANKVHMILKHSLCPLFRMFQESRGAIGPEKHLRHEGGFRFRSQRQKVLNNPGFEAITVIVYSSTSMYMMVSSRGDFRIISVKLSFMVFSNGLLGPCNRYT